MELQAALSLIGGFIVGAIALNAYDKFRITRRSRPEFTSKAPKDRRQSRFDPTINSMESKNDAARASSSALDINPGPPDSVRHKILKSDAIVAMTPPVQSEDFALYNELASLEEAALQPLNLGSGFSDGNKHKPASRHQQFMPDPKIDFVINLPGPGPVSRNQALGIYKQNEYLIEKPHKIYGLEQRTGLWSDLEKDPPHCQYSDLTLAIQMVDSKGSITESELNIFAQLALKLADTLHRPPKFPMSFEQALICTQELSAFCQTHDVLASINIVANSVSGFTGRAIEQAALRQGMEFGDLNIFHMKNDDNVGCRHLFSMANRFQPGVFDLNKLDMFKTKGITLFMSVPCAHNPYKVFDKMLDTGKKLCEILDGQMLDQENKALTEQGLQVIRAQIEQIATQMQSEGVIPGSMGAIRLFNS